jgi:CBS domain-containing protein
MNARRSLAAVGARRASYADRTCSLVPWRACSAVRRPSFAVESNFSTHLGPAATAQQHARSGITAAEILRRKRVAEADYVIQDSTPISFAVARLGDKSRVHALVVVSADNHVVGFVTARDVLRALAKAAGNMSVPVSFAMTPAEQVVHITPEDSITQAALLMSELKIGHLPVLHEGEVQGVISLQDIADITLEPARGGKDAVVRRVLPRRGLSRQTKIASTPHYPSHAHNPLYLRTGEAEFAQARRDPSLIEDAHFVSHVWWPGFGTSQNHPGHIMTYIGVADGVGSWHQYNVDPRLYARRLMSAASEFIWSRAAAGGSPPSTQQVLTAAWETVSNEKIVGSATASILALDCLQSK